MPKWWPLHYPDIAIIEEEDFNKVSCLIKVPISPILHYLRLRWLILAIKALPIIIGPYSMLYCILDVHKSWIVWGLFTIVKSKSVFIEQIHMFIVTELYWPE